ncbi:hypothetical protein BKA80DRAFT_279940 [Phyllosticta citrichinensis]
MSVCASGSNSQHQVSGFQFCNQVVQEPTQNMQCYARPPVVVLAPHHLVSLSPSPRSSHHRRPVMPCLFQNPLIITTHLLLRGAVEPVMPFGAFSVDECSIMRQESLHVSTLEASFDCSAMKGLDRPSRCHSWLANRRSGDLEMRPTLRPTADRKNKSRSQVQPWRLS